MVIAASLLCACNVEVPHDAPEIAKRAVRYEYWYGWLGLILGIGLIIFGAVLVINGVTGNASIVLTLTGGTISVPDAPIGAVLMVVGVAVIWITRPRVTTDRRK